MKFMNISRFSLLSVTTILLALACDLQQPDSSNSCALSGDLLIERALVERLKSGAAIEVIDERGEPFTVIRSDGIDNTNIAATVHSFHDKIAAGIEPSAMETSTGAATEGNTSGNSSSGQEEMYLCCWYNPDTGLGEGYDCNTAEADECTSSEDCEVDPATCDGATG